MRQDSWSGWRGRRKSTGSTSRLKTRLRSILVKKLLKQRERDGADSPIARQHARGVQEKLGVEQGLIYLPGQPAKNNEDSDMPAPFRQRRYFYYLSGLVHLECCSAREADEKKM
jgi:hypothetical protein